MPLACGSWRACVSKSWQMGGTKPTHSVYAVRELVWGVPTSNCLRAVGHGGYQVSSVGNVRVGGHGGGVLQKNSSITRHTVILFLSAHTKKKRSHALFKALHITGSQVQVQYGSTRATATSR